MEQMILKNGLRVVMENIPYLRSVSIGVWVRAGSMLEMPHENGLSHFMEHMAFKGTDKRTAKQIAEEMDAIGGHMNASTSKLCTNFYAKVIDEDLPLAMDILSDMVIHPTIDKSEMDKERGVILEEIAMVEDSPEDVVFDLASRALYGEQSLGQTILGEPERIEIYQPEDLRNYRAKHYGPKNAVVSLAGHFDKEQAVELLEKYFGSWSGAEGREFPKEEAALEEKVLYKEKDTEQVHICVGYRAAPLGSSDVYRLAVMNNILGGGMSSRLFQRIREEQGLAYSVYSGPSAYPGCGDFTVYAATNPKNAKKVIEQIEVEMHRFMDDGVSEKEFNQAKAQLKGSFVLGMESAFSRMSSMGGQMILQGKLIPPEDTLKGIDNVTMDEVTDYIRILMQSNRTVAVVGRNAAEYLQK